MVYGKRCHLPVELEHRTRWAIKEINLDLVRVGEKRLLELHVLEELHLDAYDCASNYKARSKALHDRKIKKKDFEEDDKVLVFDGKLKLLAEKRWTGPFEVMAASLLGFLELWNKDKSSSFKVDGHRCKLYFDAPFLRSVSAISLQPPP